MAKKRSRQIQPSSGIARAFGVALCEFRKRKSISQEELGFQADFDRTYISLLERGIQSPTIRTVVKLAEILQVRPSIIVRQMERVLAADGEKPNPSSKPERA